MPHRRLLAQGGVAHTVCPWLQLVATIDSVADNREFRV